MCNPVLIVMAVGTVMKGVQDYNAGQYQEGVSNYNARQLENQAVRVRNQGTEAENEQRRKTAELISRQRAQIGASGVDVDFGSPLQLQTDAAELGEIDALRIRRNFSEKALNLDEQSDLVSDQGREAAHAGKVALGVSLVSAAASGVAGAWYNSASAGASGVTAGAGTNTAWTGFSPATVFP